MPTPSRLALGLGVVVALAGVPVWLIAQQAQAPARGQGQGRGNGQVVCGCNVADSSLVARGPVRGLFTQDAYTEYEILAPGSESFRIRYLPEQSRAGSTTLDNATRGGSEGSDIQVYDPRTGKPLQFTYTASPNDPETHTIHATLPIPVPQGGIGRVLIFKTYKDERTYQMDGEDITWVRSLSGYRLGVLLPKGFGFISSDVAAQMSTTASGQLRIAFANPSGQSNPVTIHARKTTATFPPTQYTDMFFDDIKTLYDLGAPETGTIKVEQTYSDYRKGSKAKLDSLAYLKLANLQVIDLDTAKALTPAKDGAGMSVPLEVPIVDDKQSAHLKVTGTIADGSYKVTNGDLVFTRTLHGLRNTVILPDGWDVTAVSQSGTVGLQQTRQFVAFVNLNAENQYSVTIHARKR